MRHVIVGAGPAGLSAAETLRKLEPDAEVILLSGEDCLPYSRALTPQWIGGQLPEERLPLRTAAGIEALRLDLRLNCPVRRVDPAKKLVKLESGAEVSYDRLLLATGSAPTRPPVPGMDGPGVYSLYTRRDAAAILRAAQPEKQAVVVGAGLVGLQLAAALRRRNLKVALVDQFAQILWFQLDGTAAGVFHRAFQDAGVSLMMQEKLTGIKKKWLKDRYLVKLESGRELECDLVVTATGVRPNIDVVKDTAVTVKRGVVVGDDLQTSVPDVFAAGDVAEAYDVALGRFAFAATWPKACEQGRFAAHRMAGHARNHPGAFGAQFTMEYFGVHAVSLGSPRPDGDAIEVMTRGPDANGNYRKIVLSGERIVHAIVMGDLSNAGFLAALIRHRVDVRRIRDRLLDPRTGYANVLKWPPQEHFDLISRVA